MSAYGPGLEAAKGFNRQSELARYIRRVLDEAADVAMRDALLYGDNPAGKVEAVKR